MQILNAKLTEGYRAVVIPNESTGGYKVGEPVLRVQQLINGDWHGTPGSWFVETLLEGAPFTSIAIDFGQGWSVDGVYEAALEAQELYS